MNVGIQLYAKKVPVPLSPYLQGENAHAKEMFPLLLQLNSQSPSSQCYTLLYAILNAGHCFVFLCSRNLLTVLPKYLFNLPLKVLLVSNNKLVSIPEEIGKAKDLMELVSSLYTSAFI